MDFARICPAPPPVNDFDAREDALRAVVRWTFALIDGAHMSPDEARALALEASSELNLTKPMGVAA